MNQLLVAGTTALFCAASQTCLAADAPKTTNLMPMGTCSLPAGQYLVTELGSGQTLYLYVNAKGQMMVQEPKLMQLSAHHPQVPAATATTTVAPAATAATAAAPAATAAAPGTTAAGAGATATVPPSGGSLFDQVRQQANNPDIKAKIQKEIMRGIKREGPKLEKQLKKLF